MSDFGRELLACAVEGTDPDEKPLRHVADLPPRQARLAGVATLGRPGCGAGVQ